MKVVSIQIEKKQDGKKSRTLVAIVEGMIPDEAKAVSGGNSCDIGIKFVVEDMLGARERRVQGVLVPETCQATVLCKAFRMQ
jgi:hypothetical protein